MTISKKRLKEIEAIPDSKIDYSDIPETDAAFWSKATLVMPEKKEGIYLRLDPEILRWFRKKGRGYQTRMNAVLRSYMVSCARTRPDRSRMTRGRAARARRA
jgi:uncharacterized protein (DUF4415 family)